MPVRKIAIFRKIVVIWPLEWHIRAVSAESGRRPGRVDAAGGAGLPQPQSRRDEGRRSPRLPAASVGEQVGETQVVGQVQQGRHVPGTGARKALPPAPHGPGMGPQTAGDLRPRQAGRLLEPHQAMREVSGDGEDSSAVVCALPRHRARSPQESRGLSPTGASGASSVGRSSAAGGAECRRLGRSPL